MLISDWSSDVCSSDLGLALVVVELPRLPAHGEGVVVAVHLVGMAVVHRPVRLGELELPLVDHAVVPGGEHVALEAGGHELVSHDVRSRPALRRGLLLEGTEAEDVVDGPGGVADRAATGGVPTSERRVGGKKGG